MKYYFKEEMKRIFLSKNMLVAVIMAFLCMFTSILLGNFYVEKKDAVYYFMLAHSLGSASLLPLLAPVIVSLPFVASFLEDKESGFFKYLLLRISHKKYVVIRLISNALAGALALTIPLSTIFVFYALFYGVKTNGMAVGKYAGDLSWLSVNRPLLFVFSIIALTFIYGMVISTLGLGLSVIIKNRYLAIILPFILAIFTGTVLEYYGVNSIFDFHLSGIIDFTLRSYVNIKHILLYDSILFLFGVLLFVKFSSGRNGDKIE
ncbi:hypothetical protein [Clostridium sp. C8-1-8]|uniref:hypothetical protein n=1 Tax=Clostridium sp. C8-1-8 TaxID=2698831 RepID=UPI00137214E6|nr:hypothetical protein [Clostridium sp. C8-1-8]